MNEHIAFIKSTYKVLAENPATNSIFFEACCEKIPKFQKKALDKTPPLCYNKEKTKGVRNYV